mmetsp:Transcript_13793/g.43779  ORF Transcript_13793/g.43779 Transcript_13793/m.43779 type:complete len:286 (+) Transcript_13793:134-991(+)
MHPSQVRCHGRLGVLRAPVELAGKVERKEDDNKAGEEERGEEVDVAARQPVQPQVERLKEAQPRCELVARARAHRRPRGRGRPHLGGSEPNLPHPPSRGCGAKGRDHERGDGGCRRQPIEEDQRPCARRAGVLPEQVADRQRGARPASEHGSAAWRGGGGADIGRGRREQPPSEEEGKQEQASGGARGRVGPADPQDEPAERRCDERHPAQRTRRVVDIGGDCHHGAEEGKKRRGDEEHCAAQHRRGGEVDERHVLPHHLVNHARRARSCPVGGRGIGLQPVQLR